jgi:predicted dehydrogenase
MSERRIRWGILGTGGIAQVFTEDLQRLPGHEALAVGSRSPETAQHFAQKHGIPRAYGSYAELAADTDLDVVYIATPHSAHFTAAQLCLRAGRPVLVEKPFTTNSSDAAEPITLARQRNLFALEGMWTRFNPLIQKLRKAVSEGTIGDIQALYADFSIPAPYDPEHRLWSPDLAGGALLDLGVYPISFAWMLLGPPDTVQATTTPAPTGVDANTGILFGYAEGAVALLHCGLMADSPCQATIIGTKGRFEVSTPFYRPTEIILHRPNTPPEKWTLDLHGHGFTYEAEEVARCLRAGELESPHLPQEETLDIIGTLDEIANHFPKQKPQTQTRTRTHSKPQT